MAYNKVFFHGAGRGIGDMIRQVDAAGIPFTIKSISNEAWALEGLDVAKASGIKHHIIYRDPAPNGANDDHPNYSMPPDESARDHWDRVLRALPDGVKANRDAIWIEPVNEIDTHTRSQWLGDFSYEIASIAIADGYKVLLSGYNAGQPEPEMWERDFRPFLQLCADMPTKVGVSLHEGKLGDMRVPAWDSIYYPYLIGRFKFLHDACDKMQIRRPTIFISEWAWAYNDCPDYGLMLKDVEWYARLISQYPNIKGVCLWNLDTIPKMHDFIPILGNFTVNTTFPDPPAPPDPVESLEKFIWEHSLKTQCISLNASAALQSRIQRDGFHPVGTEVWVTYDGKSYAYQTGEKLDQSRPRRVYMAEVPQWNNIDYIENPDAPPPPQPPPSETVDMWRYFVPQDGEKRGPIVILKNNWGEGDERQQLQVDSSKSFLTKNSQWERRRADSKNIYLEMDTSPGADRFYTSDGVWMPRKWAVASRHKAPTNVKFFSKSDCQQKNAYKQEHHLWFTDRFDSWTSWGGVMFRDVVQVQWVVGDSKVEETYWFAAGIGLVQWRNFSGKQSTAVKLIPIGNEKDNEKEIVRCV